MAESPGSVVVLLCALVMRCSAAGPSGTYCVRVPLVAKVAVAIVDDSHVNITVSAEGTDIDCSLEAAQMPQGSGEVVLPDISKESDCVNKQFKAHGQNASTLKVSYDSIADALEVTFEGRTEELKHGNCGEVSAVRLSSSYCGEVSGVAQVRLDIVNSSHTNITASIFGAKKECANEVFQLPAEGGAVTLPDISKPEDCVNKAFQEFGQDPAVLDIMYNKTADAIEVDAQSTTVELTPGNCKKWDEVAKVTLIV